MAPVTAIAEAGSVIEPFRHLGIACSPGIAAIFVEPQAALIEVCADEVQHGAHRRFLRIHQMRIPMKAAGDSD